MKRFLQALLTTLGGIAAALLLLELVLSFLPVDQGLRTQDVDQGHPIMHFEPDRTAVWSRFPDFAMTNTVHINNLGFVNDQDYDPADVRPLVAVVGDSYVEAAMVPYAETLQGRLAADLAPGARAYSFGASGAPLSQYLAYADYARRTFRPARLVIVVVGNDFDESLLDYKQDPGFHYFRRDGDRLALVRLDYHTPGWVRLLRASSLARYLAVNVRLAALVQGLLHPAPQAEYVGQTSARADETRLEQSRQAVDAFFRLLPEMSGLPPQDVLFLVDGIRPQLYDPDELAGTAESYFARMRGYFLGRARELGYRATDMQPLFAADYAAHGERFEYPRDAHWNARGHALARQAVLDSGLLDGL